MKISLAQINTTVGDFESNLKKTLHFLEKAKKDDSDLVLFPELSLCGYPPQDLLERPDFIEANHRCLQALRRQVKDVACIVGFVDRRNHPGKKLANAAALIHQQKIIHIQHKQLLPTYDVFDEARYFEPGNAAPIFSWKGISIGLSICEDIWTEPQSWKEFPYRSDPVAEQVRTGAEILLNISASPYHFKKEKLREQMLQRQAKRLKRPIFYVNLVGGNDELIFDGRSLAINAQGKTLQRGKSFEEDFITIDTQDLSLPEPLPPKNEIDSALDALILGTRDYMQKCGFQKTVIGLSGGIDSALVAWIATQALGPQNVLGVAMPSPFSSAGSLRDAQSLAQNLKIELRTIAIGGLFEQFRSDLGENRKTVDMPLQNLQARIRGNILMAISNRENRLLLSTGNKSEMAMGYCTLYGDMSGGLSLISDVAKTMVYRLARLANRRQRAIPEATFRKAPSAELAPGQKDQDDLPDYPTLDAILIAYVEEQKTPQEIIKLGFEKKLVQKILQRLDQNEYKRRQAAPGLKISPRAFGLGRRIPISSHYRVKL